jgi:23S rRNA (adenine2503-C2)-methyltransferase
MKTKKVQVSDKDGTRKYLFQLMDGNTVETVLMKYEYGSSICVSSQVGCAMGCNFCASAIGGLERNLTAGEMLGQLLEVQRESGEKINHIVVMGTGEPLANYSNLAKFIRLVHEKDGLNIGLRNITVSTCGLISQIDRFAKDFPQVNLAISLHAPTDALRSSMMPINEKYPIDALLAACKKYIEQTGRRVTFEYALVEGVNDTTEMIDLLARKLRGMLCHVNLIPLNPIMESGLVGTRRKHAKDLQARLEAKGISATVRRELGADIDGACGQLRQNVK